MNNVKIAKLVFETLKFKDIPELEFVNLPGVYVKYDGKKAIIGCSDKSKLARGAMLLAKNISEGKVEFEIKETPNFDTCGVMLDVSRNGVMKVESIKKYLNYMLCMGMNMLMLYTEDIFEMEEYPYFGYRRGRYTIDELKKIDDYAYSIGIEVIPCIQTLGHHSQFLRWSESAQFSDTANVLLCDDGETLKLIETMIKTMRSAFRSNRIHVGLDEAHDMGRGRYMDINGYKDRFEIFSNHLENVVTICEKYDFRPMMWSDMYFRLGSKTGGYYDTDEREYDIPEHVIKAVPDVDLVYWDYYHYLESDYSTFIDSYDVFNKNIVFAGGIWTWCTCMPDTGRTYDSMIPAMRACIRKNIKEVIATVWGNGGAESNQLLSASCLAVYSEHCYKGLLCTQDDINSVTEFVTGITPDEIKAFNAFNTKRGDIILGRLLLYSDLLMPTPGFKNYDDIIVDCEKAAKQFAKSSKRDFEFSQLYELCSILCDIVAVKTPLFNGIREAYSKKDYEYLLNVSKNIIPKLQEKFLKLNALHQKLWLETNKAFGWDVINRRYGAEHNRLSYAQQMLDEYCNGKRNAIEELEEEMLEQSWRDTLSYDKIVLTSKPR